MCTALSRLDMLTAANEKMLTWFGLDNARSARPACFMLQKANMCVNFG